MPMKNRRSAQIASVVLAVIMLTTYVVHSQRQSTRSVAPSSKLIVLDGTKETWASGRKPTNALTGQKIAVAPGSKSMAPIVDVHPRTPASATNAALPDARRVMVAPGSKSGLVFDLPQSQTAVRPKVTPAPIPTKGATNVAASVKARP
jgi:hypothetical protein